MADPVLNTALSERQLSGESIANGTRGMDFLPLEGNRQIRGEITWHGKNGRFYLEVDGVRTAALAEHAPGDTGATSFFYTTDIWDAGSEVVGIWVDTDDNDTEYRTDTPPQGTSLIRPSFGQGISYFWGDEGLQDGQHLLAYRKIGLWVVESQYTYAVTASDWSFVGSIRGPQGEAGLAGVQGDPGVQGPQGQAGLPGPVGPKGDPGDAGPQGIQGEVGPAGPAGPQGVQGSAGSAGAQGPTGPAGPQGEQGLPGPGGPEGPAGAQGPAGADGEQGAPGAAGGNGRGILDAAQNAEGELLLTWTDGSTENVGVVRGLRGPAGQSVVVKGVRATFADLPTTGVGDGEGYVVEADGHLWVYDSTTDWVDAGQVRGPEGPQGNPGDPGPRGSKWYTGTTPPDGYTFPGSQPGDMYLDIVTGTVYELS